MELESETVWEEFVCFFPCVYQRGYGYLTLVCPEMFWISLFSHLLIHMETTMYLKSIFRLTKSLYIVEVSSMIIPCVFHLGSFIMLVKWSNWALFGTIQHKISGDIWKIISVPFHSDYTQRLSNSHCAVHKLLLRAGKWDKAVEIPTFCYYRNVTR